MCEQSNRKEETKRSTSLDFPIIFPANFIREIGTFNKNAFFCKANDIFFIRSGVERSSSSETKKVCPVALGWLIQQIIKSTKLSSATYDRKFFTLPKGKGKPRSIKFIKR